MAKNKKELMLEALFGGDMSPDLSSHHVQDAGRDLQIFNEMPLNKDVNSEQTENKLSTQPRTELRTISEQTTNKLRTNSSFSQLVGLQKKIIEIIYRFCRISGEKTTDKISLEFLSSNCKANTAVVQVTTRRLISKGVLSKFDSKEGRGGWTRYSLPDVVYKELFQLETENKLSTNAEQTENKLSTQPRTEPRTSGPYSSSNNLNIITTNTGEPEFSAEITLPNNLSRFGISKNNLQKLVDDKLCSLELMQKSIEALSFDVENGKTGNLAAILFGVLRSGKEYISQKYSETLQQELEQELKRIQESEENQKKILEIKLLKQFKDYVDQNPQFIESIKKKHNSFVTSNELLEKVALEEFKNLYSI